MSGAMRRIGEYLGLLEDTGRYDEYDGDYDTSDARRPWRPSRSREGEGVPPCTRVRPCRAPSASWSRREW